jgi:alkylhydroperoxidase family enzyme
VADPRPLEDLRETGLLWLINRVVFHPRGRALALHVDEEGRAVGWSLVGDGSEPWQYAAEADERELLARAEQTLREAVPGG